MTTEPTEKHREEAREIAEIRSRAETRYQSIRLGDPLEEPCPGCGCVTFAAARKDVGTLLAALASRDAEVREVLRALRYAVNRDCWCRYCPTDGHSTACLAARELYNRLQPVKEGEDGD